MAEKNVQQQAWDLVQKALGADRDALETKKAKDYAEEEIGKIKEFLDRKGVYYNEERTDYGAISLTRDGVKEDSEKFFCAYWNPGVSAGWENGLLAAYGDGILYEDDIDEPGWLEADDIIKRLKDISISKEDMYAPEVKEEAERQMKEIKEYLNDKNIPYQNLELPHGWLGIAAETEETDKNYFEILWDKSGPDYDDYFTVKGKGLVPEGRKDEYGEPINNLYGLYGQEVIGMFEKNLERLKPEKEQHSMSAESKRELVPTLEYLTGQGIGYTLTTSDVRVFDRDGKEDVDQRAHIVTADWKCTHEQFVEMNSRDLEAEYDERHRDDAPHNTVDLKKGWPTAKEELESAGMPGLYEAYQKAEKNLADIEKVLDNAGISYEKELHWTSPSTIAIQLDATRGGWEPGDFSVTWDSSDYMQFKGGMLKFQPYGEEPERMMTDTTDYAIFRINQEILPLRNPEQELSGESRKDISFDEEFDTDDIDIVDDPAEKISGHFVEGNSFADLSFIVEFLEEHDIDYRTFEGIEKTEIRWECTDDIWEELKDALEEADRQYEEETEIYEPDEEYEEQDEEPEDSFDDVPAEDHETEPESEQEEDGPFVGDRVYFYAFSDIISGEIVQDNEDGTYVIESYDGDFTLRASEFSPNYDDFLPLLEQDKELASEEEPEADEEYRVVDSEDEEYDDNEYDYDEEEEEW